MGSALEGFLRSAESRFRSLPAAVGISGRNLPPEDEGCMSAPGQPGPDALTGDEGEWLASVEHAEALEKLRSMLLERECVSNRAFRVGPGHWKPYSSWSKSRGV